MPLQRHLQQHQWRVQNATRPFRKFIPIITSAEVIIAEYDAILGQWERANFYNHLSNYTKTAYSMLFYVEKWMRFIDFTLAYTNLISKEATI